MAKFYYIHSEKGLMGEVRFFDSAKVAWFNWVEKFSDHKDLKIDKIENEKDKYIFEYTLVKTVSRRRFCSPVIKEFTEVRCKYDRELKIPRGPEYIESYGFDLAVENAIRSHGYLVSQSNYMLNVLSRDNLKDKLQHIFENSEIKCFESSLGKFELREFETGQNKTMPEMSNAELVKEAIDIFFNKGGIDEYLKPSRKNGKKNASHK